MNRVVIALVVLLGCQPKVWEGIPESRTCSDASSTGAAVCVADGKVYHCVLKDDRRMLCSRDTVEIKCTNIVNVETVCPGK